MSFRRYQFNKWYIRWTYLLFRLHITNNWSYGNAYTLHRTKSVSDDIRPDVARLRGFGEDLDDVEVTITYVS